MSKLTNFLTEDLIGRRNENIPKKEIAKEIEKSMEDVCFELESIATTGDVGVNYKKQIDKYVIQLRKLGFEISKDIRSRK